MKDKHTDSNKRSDFHSTLHEIESLYFEATHSRDFRSGADKIRIDSKWTTLFQRLNRLGNSDILSGFKLRIEMDEEEDQQEIHQK
jgi:hypothetical protein